MAVRHARKRTATIRIGDLAAQVRLGVTERTLLTMVIGEFTINAIRRAYRLFDGDLALFLVFGEIAQYNSSRALRSLQLRDAADSRALKSMMRTLHDEEVLACNALSISAATGIPRETVRSKVKILERRGWIVRQGTRRLTLTAEVIEGMRALEPEILQQFWETARLARLITDGRGPRREVRPAPAGGESRASPAR